MASKNTIKNILAFSKTLKVVETAIFSENKNGVNWKLLNFKPLNLN